MVQPGTVPRVLNIFPQNIAEQKSVGQEITSSGLLSTVPASL